MTDKLETVLNGMWDSLTDEQKKKAKACNTMEELMGLAGREGIELPDEALDQVAGGCGEGSEDTFELAKGRGETVQYQGTSFHDKVGFN